METTKEIDFHYLPHEIILVILNFCSFNCKFNFFSTCRKFCDFTNFRYIGKDPVLYIGRIQFINGKISFVFNNLHAFSNIEKLVLKTTDNIFGLHNFKLTLPNLKKLRLISPIRFFLINLTMPQLIHLDIVLCPYCVLDNCDIPMLKKLYICVEFESPFRFCKISKYALILVMRKKYVFGRDLFYSFINKEIINAKEKLRNHKLKIRIDHNEIVCLKCSNICESNVEIVRCIHCILRRPLTLLEKHKLHKRYFPYKRPLTLSEKHKFYMRYGKCDVTCSTVAKSIFMDKNGYGNSYCNVCGNCVKLSKLEMCVAGKINNTMKYPIIHKL